MKTLSNDQHQWLNARTQLLVSIGSALSLPEAKIAQRELSLPWNFRSVEQAF